MQPLNLLSDFFQSLASAGAPQYPETSILLKQIAQLHASPYQGLIEEMGVGVFTQQFLLSLPGASQTLMQGRNTYAKSLQTQYYGITQRSVSVEAVTQIAQRLRAAHPQADFVMVLSGSTDTHPEINQGDNHLWLALANRQDLWQVHLRLVSADRLNQQISGALMALALLCQFLEQGSLNPETLPLNPLQATVQIDVMARENEKSFAHLLRHIQLLRLGWTPLVMVQGGESPRAYRYLDLLRNRHLLLQKGSFNPPTLAHESMLAQVLALPSTPPDMMVLPEITLNNADKVLGSLDNIAHRLMMLSRLNHPVCLSTQTTLYETRELLCHTGQAAQVDYVCGEDLYLRLFYEKYYEHLPGKLKEGLARMFGNHSQLYVLGRETPLHPAASMVKATAPYQQDIHFIPSAMPQASSDLRAQIAAGDAQWKMHVKPEIAAYIQSQNLYKNNANASASN